MAIIILTSDLAFSRSLKAGHPECICSRCYQQIPEDDCPIRLWETNKNGQIGRKSTEYRFCSNCIEGLFQKEKNAH